MQFIPEEWDILSMNRFAMEGSEKVSPIKAFFPLGAEAYYLEFNNWLK
jgi:hypothetical protein